MGTLNDRWVSTEHCFVYFIGCCHALSPNSAWQLHCTLQCTGERLVGGWSGPLGINAGMGRSSSQSTNINTTLLTTMPCICAICPDFIEKEESLCKASPFWLLCYNHDSTIRRTTTMGKFANSKVDYANRLRKSLGEFVHHYSSLYLSNDGHTSLSTCKYKNNSCWLG